MGIFFLKGKNVYLRPVCENDVNHNYLSWLNDPEVNEFSRRRRFPTSEKQMRSFFETVCNNQDNLVLAIASQDKGTHIGNIQLGPIQWVSRSAELSILIGDKEWWNKGVCGEAITLLTSHAFDTLNLHRLFAGTINPAFAKVMEKLGWTHEGTFKDADFINGKYVDSCFFGKIKS